MHLYMLLINAYLKINYFMISMNVFNIYLTVCNYVYTERGSSMVECRTRNQVSPGSNPPLVPFGRLGIFLLSIDAPVDSAV